MYVFMLVFFCFIRYAPRWDCGCKYEIQIELLNQRKKPIETFAPETIYFEQWNDQQWNQVGEAQATPKGRVQRLKITPAH